MEPKCNCGTFCEFTIVITGYPAPTEASRRIAAMYQEIPLLFDVDAAERIGDACVGELEGL